MEHFKKTRRKRESLVDHLFSRNVYQRESHSSIKNDEIFFYGRSFFFNFHFLQLEKLETASIHIKINPIVFFFPSFIFT